MSQNPNPVEIVITSPSEVVEALNCPDLAPPSCPASLGQGATALLRDGMARFSHHKDHEHRRLAIEQAIASLDGFAFEQRSYDRARSFLDGAPSTATTGSSQAAELPDETTRTRITQVVPTETLASALGVADSDLDEVRRDAEMLAATIGRGEPASQETDEAATRLLDRFASHPGGAVANVSLLYQNHDATAALIAAFMEGHRAGSPRQSALQRTVRLVKSETTLVITPCQENPPNQAGPGPRVLATGTVLSLSLRGLEVEFGAGAHQCPGETMAKDIAAGIVRALGFR